MSKDVEKLKLRAERLLQRSSLDNEQINTINKIAWALCEFETSLASDLSAKMLSAAARNDYSLGRAYALRTLCRYSFLQARHYDAKEIAEKSVRIFTHSEDKFGLGTAINSLALTKREIGDYDGAINDLSSALQLCEQLGDQTSMAGIYNNLAYSNTDLGNYPIALDNCYQALFLSSNQHDSYRYAVRLSTLGQVFQRIGEWVESINYLETAIGVFELYPKTIHYNASLIYLGAAYQSSKNYEKALENYQKAFRLGQEIKSSETLATVFMHLGWLHFERAENQLSISYLLQALEIAQKFDGRFFECQILLILGLTYKQIGDENESLKTLEQTLNLNQRLGAKEISYKANLALSQIYEGQGRITAALFHFKEFDRLIEEVHGPNASRRIEQILSQIKTNTLFLDRMTFLRRQSPDSKRPHNSVLGDKRNPLPPTKLNRVIKFINQNLNQNLTLTDLAGVAALSQNYFARCFKESTGKTPHQFLVEQRVMRARHLLSTTNLSLLTIASQCGFSNQSHLTTQFRLIYGYTPHQFRRLNQDSQTAE